MQTRCVGGDKTIGDPPTDPSPKDWHWVQDGRGGFQTVEPYTIIGARSERAKARQR